MSRALSGVSNTGIPGVEAKELLQSGEPGCVVQQFRNGTKRDTAGSGGSKAAIANEVSAYLFGYLKGYKIPTHFVEKLSESAMLVRKLDAIPLTVTVWNVATKEFCKRFGGQESLDLALPVIEHCYARPGKGAQLVNEFHVYALNIATPQQLRNINRLASKANIVLRSFFARRELRLAALQLQFGAAGDQMMIAGEISPATCRVIDMRKRRKGITPLTTLDGASTIGTYAEFRNRVFGTVLEG